MPPIPELEAIRKAQIIDAGMRTIAERGCANVTMDDVCRAAGMSKGGLAHYYRSKNELFKSVFQEFFERIFQRGRDTMGQLEDPLDRILSFDWLYDLENPDMGIGYPLLFDFMAIAVHDDDYREIFHGWIDGWVALLREALREGLDRGLFTDLDPESTARTISAIYQGIATRWFLDPACHTTPWAVASFRKAIMGLLGPHITAMHPPENR
ncbi:MAG: TetR/AcrR family transcriptional regulator [Pseudomonadota bacterium]